jgi:DNA replication protein DnaC
VERRAQKQLALRLRRGTLNTTKTLEEFSFTFNPGINRQQVLALAAGDYLRERRNVLICGPAGVGKSHLAQALGQEACRQGYEVLFVNTHKMLQHLHGGRADNSLERRLATYLRPDLLILDDFGLRALSAPSPEDLYDVINERYEKGSIVLTGYPLGEPFSQGVAGAVWRSFAGFRRVRPSGRSRGNTGHPRRELSGADAQPFGDARPRFCCQPRRCEWVT